MVGLKRISTALGLMVAMTSAASAQEVAANQNQSTANAVAGTLRASRNLAGYRIEIETREGLVTLTGTLATPAQKAEAIARTRYIAGVRGVVDQLRVTNDKAVNVVQYQPNMQYQQNPMVAYGHGGGFHGGMSGGGMNYGPGQPGSTAGGINYGTGAGTTGAAPAYDGSPVPEGPAGMTGATQAAQPGYPNYAWPSYAPYPNFSAVGYPTAYPWQGLAEHRLPSLPIPKSSPTGVPLPFAGMTASVGWTSRSTTPGRDTRPNR